MRQIGETFSDVGDLSAGRDIFEGIASLCQLVAEETELGREKKRGKGVQDVVSGVEDGLRKRRRRGEGDQDLSSTWRGSWS